MLSVLYKHSLSLLTDLYQLTMSYGYFKEGMADREAVFHLFFRKNPFQGNYAVACGLRSVISFIENFKFTDDDINYLRNLKGNDQKPLFDEDFLVFLKDLKFTGDIDAVEEGRIVFAHEPLLRIRAPLVWGQLLETPLLNMINFQTLIATKTNRICTSAKGDPVMEFGLRRAQGIDGALSCAYASIVGGASSTSNVLAGKLYDIPIKGTHAHSWIMSFPTELEAFSSYAKSLPNNCIFLVDTYDTREGIQHAIQTAKKLKKIGKDIIGIRLDSGDLCELSKMAREMLDAAGFENALIVASNDLDEYSIERLKKEGAKIDVWGVGTKLATAYDQPALGGVYKLSAISNGAGWDYKVKKSEDLIKVSNPGILQVKRYEKDSKYVCDILCHEGFDQPREFVPFHLNAQEVLKDQFIVEDLLKPIFKKGSLVYHDQGIKEASDRRKKDLEKFSEAIQSNQKTDDIYSVGLEGNLYQMKVDLLKKINS